MKSKAKEAEDPLPCDNEKATSSAANKWEHFIYGEVYNARLSEVFHIKKQSFVVDGPCRGGCNVKLE